MDFFSAAMCGVLGVICGPRTVMCGVPSTICGPQTVMCGPDSTHNEAPFAKMPIFHDNHHKNKVIFYGGFSGGAVYEKYQ